MDMDDSSDDESSDGDEDVGAAAADADNGYVSDPDDWIAEMFRLNWKDSLQLLLSSSCPSFFPTVLEKIKKTGECQFPVQWFCLW